MNGEQAPESIAIVGLAGRFPDAPDVGALWRNLREGRGAVRPLTEDELAAVDPQVRRHPDYVAVGATVPDVDQWDAAFFGFSPREAAYTDPQQRLFLECSWEAVENAGYDPRNVPGVVGVISGCNFPTYLQNNIAGHDELIAEVGHLPIAIRNDRDGLSTLVSYKMDLRGPSMAVQTSCSTSMLAVHLACQSLLSYETDMMLAGGVSITTPQASGYVYEDGGIAARDGVCRALDASAKGGVFSNGVGVVLLKRTSEALRDRDQIYAVILGTASNNDGIARAGYAAPGLRGQREVITEAMAVAGVGPDDISYVEAHGTGTLLGDAIELEALSKAFDARDRSGPPCTIGSVKSNLGHVDRASGVTGLIRTALMLKHRTLLPQVNFTSPNPGMPADLFRVNTELVPWPEVNGGRRAVIDSFGLGGTNAAAVVAEAPAALDVTDESGRAQVLVLSARTPAALEAATGNLSSFLAERPDLDLADVAFTLQTGRTGFNHRRVLTAASVSEAVAALDDAAGRTWTADQDHRDRRVTLVVPERIPVTAADARALCATEPLFREAFDAAATAIGAADPFGSPAFEALVGYAAGRLLHGWGITPANTVGVGTGAVVAGVLAGTLPLAALADGASSRPQDADLGALDPHSVIVELGDGRLLRATDPGGANDSALRLAALPDPHAGGDASRALRELLGRLWLAGVSPQWTELYRGPRRRVRLPTYPFERRTCWIDPVPRGTGGRRSRERYDDVADWFYVPAWRQAPRLTTPGFGRRLVEAGPWLVLGTDSPTTKAVADRLEAAGATVRAAEWAPGTALDAELAAEWMRPRPRTIVYLRGLAGTPSGQPAEALADFDERLDAGFYGIRRLLGALADEPGSEQVRIVAVTRGGVAVHPADPLSPADAAVAALCRVAPQENPGISCRTVDVDATLSSDTLDALLADVLEDDPTAVAYRGGARWALDYVQQRLPEPDPTDGPLSAGLREGGVYLITGGLGQVPLALAEHLAVRYRARLVLFNRTGLPPVQEWDAVLADPSADARTAGRIRRVRALEAAGAQVLVLAVDVADRARVAAAVAEATARFGPLNGVIHGAGLSGEEYFGITHDLARQACDEHFRGKVHGMAALAQEIDLDRLDFCLSMSSLSLVLGGIGHGAYAAANAALDALVVAMAGGGRRRLITVDWDAWQNSIERGEQLGGAATVSPYSSTYAEGCAAFERALTAVGALPLLVNSTGDLHTRLSDWVVGDTAVGGGERHPRPALATAYVPPADEVETKIAEVWQEVMGLVEVGVLDNFFELGGHSLMAVQVIGRIRAALGVNVPLAVLGECPTVRQMAERIQAGAR
ncbi:hypothetical protein Val02_56920 [Virgisporangium aliadipatigenens]|uniref:Uncharacterized protein n=1 Tax=Virgisporangium aliadipatigenens TaxID=741659 RepID=A0A8J4DT39_9ACTN|nr:SDR family oxidoreductase [Virgisporangium aliadipatigenens]GIJ48806.1 hypothetical protein Val02_56920 [Virgisporangium aliadipatigenens]